MMGPIVTFIPTALEFAVLEDIVASVRPILRPGQSHEVIEKAERLGANAADALSRIASKIQGLLEHRATTGVIIVDVRDRFDSELARLPKTPLEFSLPNVHQLTELDVARCALIGAAKGFSYSFSAQAEGTLCDDVMPIKKYEFKEGYSAGKEVGWHTEDAPFSRSDDDNCHPVFDILSFVYLRNPNDDPTVVTMPDLAQLDTAVLAELRKPQYYTMTSIAQGGDENTFDAPTSFIYGDEKLRFSFARLSEQRTSYTGKGQMAAIDAFISFLDESRAEIPAKPGTIAFVDNMRVAHGRAEWKKPPKFDGSDRWQRRLGCSNAARRVFLESLMPSPRERVIDKDMLKGYFASLVSRGSQN